MHRIGMPELLVILAIALVIFGKDTSQDGRSIGKTIGNFKPEFETAKKPRRP